jgi:hypothetical protein
VAVAFVRTHTGVSIKTAGTTNIGVNISTATTAGNLLVARILFDNFTTASKPIVSSIAKMAGETNSWVLLGAARSTSTSAGAFASGEIWAIQTTVDWSVATYTVTLDSSVTMKATITQEFSGVKAVARSTAGTAYSTSTTAASATTTGTTPVIGDLALGFIFGSNVAAAMAGDTDTTGGSWSAVAGVGSTGSGAATNNFGIGQYKILTGANHQTLNNSATMTAGNGSIVAILQQYVAPSITQAAYRLYADGTESGSTALAAQNASYTADVTNGDVNLQVRTLLQATAGDAGLATDDWQLQWKRGDEYVFANYDSSSVALVSAQTQVVQSFIGSGGPLTQATFYLSKSSSPPTGTVSAVLYAHDGGTFGSTGLPTGSPLATSTNSVAATTPPTFAAGGPAAFVFDFDGTITLTPGTPYFIGLVASGAATSNSVDVAIDGSGTHAGRTVIYSTGWNLASATIDLIFEVGSWADVSASGVLLASLPETASNGAFANVSAKYMANQFVGNGRALARAGFYISRGTTGAGTTSMQLFASSGPFDSGSSVPTGSALATVAGPSIASLLTSGAWYHRNFDGTYVLQSGTPYFIVLYMNPTSSTGIAESNDAGVYTGDSATGTSGPTWASDIEAVIFEVYAARDTVLPYASPNLTDAAATTNRLTGGTGSFVAGKVSEDGLVDDLALTVPNFTELLYSVTLKQADLANGDTLGFRVLRNGATTDLTYTQVPTITIGTAGPSPQTVTVTGITTGETFGTSTATVSAWPKIATFTDTFSGSLDTAKWTTSGGGAATSGGQLQLPVLSSYAALVQTNTVYELLDSAVYAKFTPPSVGNQTKEFRFRVLCPDVSNVVEFMWAQNNFLNLGSPTDSYSGGAAWVTNEPWWRISSVGQVVYWHTSVDGTTWTQRGTVTTALNLTACGIRFEVGYFGTESASNAFVDNVNFVPAPALPPKNIRMTNAATVQSFTR